MKNHILYLVCLANETGRTNLVWLGTGTDWLRSSSSYGLQKESAVTCAMQQMDSLHPIYMQAPKPLEALAAHLPSGSRLWCPADGSSSHLALAVRGAVVPPRQPRPPRSGASGAAAVPGATQGSAPFGRCLGTVLFSFQYKAPLCFAFMATACSHPH